jgi:8-oxo-dGTP pyrophosphatase MutT (NUDIX family)
MDVTFKTDEGRFNYRVCAVIINNNKILVMHDERSPYYYLPGGRVKLNETAEAAVLREVKEELGVDARIERPIWLAQSFFVEEVDKEKYHELCLYFLIDITSTTISIHEDKFIRFEEKMKLSFEWLKFENLASEYLYPLFIKKEILNLPRNLTIISEYK